MLKRGLLAGVIAVLVAPNAHAQASDVPSTAYTGYYYRISPDEDARKCIAWRESRNTTKAVSSGGHMGLYQMTAALGEGAAWMMRVDPVEPITRAQRVWLQAHPITSWSRYWQDRAWYTVWNYSGKASGAKHWFLSGSACNALAGSR